MLATLRDVERWPWGKSEITPCWTTVVNQTQRLGLKISTAGLGVALLGVVILQIDPHRLETAHQIVHRAGLFLMLAGLVVFLAAKVQQRRGLYIETLLRRTAENLPNDFAASSLRTVGATLMAATIAGELLAAATDGRARDVLLICIGLPGGLIWLIGAFAGVVSGFMVRRNAERPVGPDNQRAVVRQNSSTE